jgi:adenylate cyclase
MRTAVHRYGILDRHAERLGETGFLDFLNRFIADVTGPIVAQLGTIHKYVGDEIIVTWPLAAGIRDGHCVRACFDALAKLNAFADDYIRDFGRCANFRAALHCGPVVIGERLQRVGVCTAIFDEQDVHLTRGR